MNEVLRSRVQLQTPAKPKRRSRVLWFNGAMATLQMILLVATTLQTSHLLPDPRIETALTLILICGNTVLRFLTTQPISGGRPF